MSSGTDIASLGIDIDTTDAVDGRANLDALTAAGQRLEGQTERNAAANQRATMAAQQRMMQETSLILAQQRQAEAALEQEKAAQKVLDRYDPMGAKMRQLTNDLAALRKAFGDSVDPGVMRAFQNIEGQIDKVSRLTEEAGLGMESVGKKGGQAVHEFSLASATAQRELMILGHEAMNGNFSRMPGSFMVLASRTNLLASGILGTLAPLLAAGAALGAFVAYEGHLESMSRSLGVIQAQLAGMGRQGEFTKGQLQGLVEQLETVGHMSRDSADKVLGAFASETGLSRQMFVDLVALVPTFARAVGEDAPQAASKLAKAFGEPLTGVLQLDKQMNILTLDQYKQVEAMVKHGDATGAAAIGLKALQDRMKSVQGEGLTPLQRGWDDLVKAWKGSPQDVEKASGAMDTLGKKLSLMADMVREVRIGYQAMLDLAKFGLEKVARSVFGDEKVNKYKDDEAHIQHVKDMADQDARAEAVAQQNQLARQAREKEQYEVNKMTSVEKIDSLLKIQEIQNKSAKEYYDTQEQIHTISKKQNEEIQLALDLEMLMRKRAAEQRKADLGGYTAAQEAAHKLAMQQIDEEIKARKGQLPNVRSRDTYADEQRQAAADAASGHGENNAGLDAIQALNDRIKKQQEYFDALGKSKEQVERLKIAEIDREIVRVQMNYAGNEQDKAYIANLDAQIAKLMIIRGIAVDTANKQHELSEADRIASDWSHAGKVISEALSSAFGNAGRAAGQMFKDYADGMAKQAKIDKDFAAQKDKDGRATAEATRQYQTDTAQNSMKTYGDMADAAAGFFEKNSRGYEALMTVSRIFHMAEIALEVSKMVPKAINAILTQGEGDPYTAFARMAAMAAIVAGLGVAVGGGSYSANTTAQTRQSANGTGSILGDSSAKSDSLLHAIEAMKSNSDQELTYQSTMAQSLLSIDSQMSALAAAVARQVGSTGSPFGAVTQPSYASTAHMLGIGAGAALGAEAGSYFGPWGTVIGGVIGAVVGALTRVSTQITDAGITISQQMVGSARQNFQAQNYQDVTTHTSLFGISLGNRTTPLTANVDPGLARSFSLLIDQIATSIAAAVDILQPAGTDFAKFNVDLVNFINGLQIPNLQISLKGLNGADIQKALEQAFSKMSDDLAAQVINRFAPGVAAFQRAGEGLYQTLIRVALGVEKSTAILDRFGIAAVRWQDVVNKTGDVATEIVRQSIVKFETSADGVVSGVGKIIDAFDGSVDDMATIYQKLLDLRSLLRETGNDAAAGNLSSDMLRGAGGVSKFQSGLQAVEGMLTPDQLAKGKWREFALAFGEVSAKSPELAGVLQRLGIDHIPKTNQEFMAMLGAIDTTTASGQYLYGALVALAPSFVSAGDAAQQAADKAKAAVSSFLQAAAHASESVGNHSMNTAAAEYNFHAAAAEWASKYGGGYSTQDVISAVSNLTAGGTDRRVGGGWDAALAYAQSKGPEAVAALTNLINSYGDYNDSVNQASQNTGQFAQAADAAAQALIQQQQQIKDWAYQTLGGDKSPLLPAEKLKVLLDQYDRVVATGDRGAFTNSADSLLSEAKKYYASSDEYTAIFTKVMSDAERLGGFSLGADKPTGAQMSIDSLRQELGARAAQEKSDRETANKLMQDAIDKAKNNTDEQIVALQQAIAGQTTALQGLISSLKRD